MKDVYRATLGDLDQLSKLFDAYRVFYGKETDVDSARAFLQERLERDESVVFVARVDQRLVGFTQLYPAFSSVQMKRILILNDLFVAPDSRRTGVAGSLMEVSREYARSLGAAWLQLETAVDNHSARSLYERMGYTSGGGYMTYLLKVNV